MSTRGVVETNANVMIGGFIVGAGLGTNGDGSSEVLIRALGPELTGFGISDALQDPTMELHDGNGNLLLANDNWKDSQQAAIQATGLASGDNREPATLTTLIQGNWTAMLRGKNNTTGVGLIELYRIHEAAADPVRAAVAVVRCRQRTRISKSAGDSGHYSIASKA
jgi:hypothetical protein